jgi:putative phosphoribosyl transferase
MSFRDREAAGAALAGALVRYARRPDLVVLGLVRGGVPVAAAVAQRLEAPLDALVVRKLGLPWEPEVAFGALGPAGVCVLNDDLAAGLPLGAVDTVLRQETLELGRREDRYRAGRPPLNLDEQVAVLVDDGLATGASARAGAVAARRLGARWVVVAVPVGAPVAVDEVLEIADEVVCPLQPADFDAVSCWYEEFEQVSDAEVEALLGRV